MKCPKCKQRNLHRNGRGANGKQRWICKFVQGPTQGPKEVTFCYTTTDPTAPYRGQNMRAKAPPKIFRRSLPEGAKRFVITAAQNATPVHKDFFACLKTLTKAYNAELLVIPLRYKNPTSRWTASQANEEAWADEVQPYLWNVRRLINTNLTLLADIKTQPTAIDPLTGFDSITGGTSGILGHTKMHMRTIATPQNRMAKIMTTTGACTVPNYTDSRTGKLGEFHHSLSALIVEVHGKKFHLRQLHFDTKTESVTDLTTRFSPRKFRRAPRPLALIMGDTHVDFIDPSVEAATFGKDGMAQTLQPECYVFHDLLDAYAVNPHHLGNPFIKIAKHRFNRSNVAFEVKRAIDFVAVRVPRNASAVIVSSNHDDMLRRWVLTHDWKTDPENARFYLETALAMEASVNLDGSGASAVSPFAYWARKSLPGNSRCLGSNESVMLGGVELGLHGDRGPNGARGSAKNLRRIGVRSIIGHSHSPCIEEGCYQVGTSTRLRLEYNSGPSSWLNTHCILHADGKRQLINIIDGEWRL